MNDTVQAMTLEESVRKRPIMYIGNDRMVGLFNGLLIDIVEICKTDNLIFEITILSDREFILGITSNQVLNKLWTHFSSENDDLQNYFPKVLHILASYFQIKHIDKSKTEISFTIEEESLISPNIDYLNLNAKMLQFALLNRNCEIITIDKRQKVTSQNFFHFPQGIFYLFDKATTEILGKPEFKLTIEREINNKQYQIGLAFRTDWYPSPNIISFANDVHNICGGSLVDGILDGLLTACKTYKKENNLTTYKVTRKKFTNGLILICAVRGQDFKYGGSWKETLENDEVQKDVKKIVSELALEFFKTEKEKAYKFLWRFDTTQLTSGMY